MDKNMAVPRLLTVKAAADSLGLSVWTIRAWAYAGRIATNKLGRRLMVPAAEIERLLTETLRPRLGDANGKH